MKQAAAKTIDAIEVPGISTCIHCGYPDYRLSSCKCVEEAIRAERDEVRDQVQKVEAEVVRLRAELKAVERWKADQIVWSDFARAGLAKMETALETSTFESPEHRLTHREVLSLLTDSKALRAKVP